MPFAPQLRWVFDPVSRAGRPSGETEGGYAVSRGAPLEVLEFGRLSESQRAATLGPPVALLLCHRDRAELYDKHAFTEIDPPVLIRQPDGYVQCPIVAMWRSLREGATLPAGQVTVHSLPF